MMRPRVSYDVSETQHKRLLAKAKHDSQHILWGHSKENFQREAKLIKAAGLSGQKFVEQFYLADDFVLRDFPAR